MVYIDNYLLIGPSSSYIANLKVTIARTYKIKDLGEAKFFLGV